MRKLRKAAGGLYASITRISTLLGTLGGLLLSTAAFAAAPVANDDSYSTTVDTPLHVSAPGVLSNDTDADSDPLTAGVVSSTTHGNLTLSSNGSFDYSPDPLFFGSDSFTYQANDGTNLSNVATVSITVSVVNHPPVAVDDAFTVNQDSSGNSFNVLANDTDPDAGDTKTITATGATNHGGTVAIVGGGANNTLSYTPAAGFFGTETFTYTMKDTAGLTDSATVTVTVSHVNHPPVAVDDAFTVNQDSSGNSFNVLANDTDPDAGDTKTITATGATNHGGTVSLVGAGANNTLSYTPAAGFFGTETFSYTMKDTAGLTDSATVTVTVSHVNHPPVAANDAFTVNQDTSGNSFNVLANDTDPDTGDTKTITATGATNNGGTVSIVGAGANNTLSYTPAAAFVGTETFTYTMRDTAGLTSAATVTVTVAAVNHAPNANNDAFTVNQDTSNNSFNVLANDTDSDAGDTKTITATGATNNGGTVSIVGAGANNTLSYTPAAGFSGTETFTYTMKDTAGLTDSATVTVTVSHVNHPPVAVNDAFTVNQDTSNNSFNVLANDTDPDAGDTKTITATGATNNGGTVSIVGAGANNTLSYTPAAGFFGTETFTYTMKDTAGLTDTATVTVTVSHVNHPPVAVNDTFNVNEHSSANTFNVLANDTDPDAGDTKTITAVGATNHGGAVSIVGGGANNTLSYTPATTYVGAETFTYTMKDTAGLTSSATVTVTVVNVNDPPVAVDDAFTVNEDSSANSFNVLANDTDLDTGDTKTITAVGATNHSGTVSIVGASANNSLSYAPAAGFFGTETFTYTMKDTAGLTASATVTVTVSHVNHPPVAVNDAVNVNEHSTANSLNVLANDTDPDAGDTKTITATGATNHGGTVSIVGAGANNTLSYTPATTYVGTETFTYTMKDTAGLTSTATVTVTVVNVNDPPVAVDDAFTVNQDTTANSFNVLANDTDPDAGDTKTITAVGATNHSGTVSIVGPGVANTLSYTPAAGYFGTETFTYTMKDTAGLTASATVTVTVAHVNHPPVSVADTYSTNEDTPLVVPANGVLANDTDPDVGDTFTAVLGTTVAHGSLTLNADGSFTYTPAPNYNGSDSFTYHAHDSGQGQPALDGNTVTVSITVVPVNDPPTFTSTPPTTATDDATYVYAVTASDPDNTPSDPNHDILVIAAPTLPTWLTLTPGTNGTATLQGKPAQANVGVNHVVLTVSDPTGPAVQQPFDITVTHINVPPKVQDPIPDQTATEAVPYTLSLAQFVTDPDKPASSLTYAATSGLPASLLLSAAGTISGTPVTADVGPHVVKFTVSDGIAPPVPGSFNLNVLRAGRADLAITLTATPNPVAINGADTWTFAIKNNAPTVDVPGVTLTATFAGEVPFQFDAPSDPGCTFSVVGSTTQLSCTLGPVAGGMTRNLALTGHGGFAGDVFANAKVAVTDPVPIDETPANDTTTTALSVAQRVSSGPAQTISGLDARAIAAGDFNGDGFVDLAVAAGPGQSTGVLLNIVDPANASRRILSSTPIALGGASPSRAIAVADFNGDHNLDIVTAGGAGFPSRVYLNSGSAAFTAANVGDGNDDSYAVAVGDINGDGLPDIVFANNGPTSVYLNRGSGIFELAAKLGTANSRGAVLVDLFGDALPELVLANASGDATVYRNTAGVFSLELTLPTGPTTSVTAADLNGDQRADLVFGRDTSTLPAAPSAMVWLNTSMTSGSFFLSDQLGASLNGAVAAADIDLNGSTDIIVVNETGAHQVYANSGTSSGAFNLFPQELGFGGAQSIATGKFSVDARVDVALAGPSGIAVFYNDGAGNLGGGDLTPPTITLLGAATVTITVGDPYTDAGATATDALDGDLTAKIVTTNPVNNTQVGSYTVTYNVKDTSGNAATPATRTVTVKAIGGSTGGGGATGLEFVLGLTLAMIAARLQREGRWRARKP